MQMKRFQKFRKRLRREYKRSEPKKRGPDDSDDLNDRTDINERDDTNDRDDKYDNLNASAVKFRLAKREQ